MAARKSSAEKWDKLSPPERLKERAKAVGYVVAQTVAVIVFCITGADIFVFPQLSGYLHLDPTRAQDIFLGLCGYYGIPLLRGRFSHASRS